MRSILVYLEEKGDTTTIEKIIASFYRLNNVVDRGVLDEAKAKTLLAEFKAAVGNNPIEREIQKRERAKKIQEAQQRVREQQNSQKQLERLNVEFLMLSSLQGVTPQERGYRLEKLFFELLRINEIEYTPPYKTVGEQIDGHFRYEMFDYLCEIKWTSETTKQLDLAVFDGKIRGKAQSTRGLFLSASGFDENAVSKFSGDSPRILLMNGEDLAFILNGNYLLFDALKAKVDALVRYGRLNSYALKVHRFEVGLKVLASTTPQG